MKQIIYSIFFITASLNGQMRRNGFSASYQINNSSIILSRTTYIVAEERQIFWFLNQLDYSLIVEDTIEINNQAVRVRKNNPKRVCRIR